MKPIVPRGTSENENEVKRAFQDYITKRGIWGLRLNTGVAFGYVKFGKNGMADFITTIDGRCVWVEIKKEKQKQGQAQTQFQAWVESYGHEYLLVVGMAGYHAAVDWFEAKIKANGGRK